MYSLRICLDRSAILIILMTAYLPQASPKAEEEPNVTCAARWVTSPTSVPTPVTRQTKDVTTVAMPATCPGSVPRVTLTQPATSN